MSGAIGTAVVQAGDAIGTAVVQAGNAIKLICSHACHFYQLKENLRNLDNELLRLQFLKHVLSEIIEERLQPMNMTRQLQDLFIRVDQCQNDVHQDIIDAQEEIEKNNGIICFGPKNCCSCCTVRIRVYNKLLYVKELLNNGWEVVNAIPNQERSKWKIFLSTGRKLKLVFSNMWN